MNLHTRSPLKGPGLYPIVERGKQLKYLSFRVLELGGTFKEFSTESGDEELAVDFYSGPVRVQVRSSGGELSMDTQPRTSLREAGEMLYVPAGSTLKIHLLGETGRISLSGAEGKPGVGPKFVSRDQVMTQRVGRGNFQRIVHTHIADNVDAAHLIVGETVNEPGAWSSCPPHKHDANNPPSEVPMEEVYFFQLEPREGFGFMRVYSDAADTREAFDQAVTVQDGDTVIIPRGYHPVAAFPGYTLNYTWALAGEGRKYGAWTDDPRYAWIRQS